jgi:hypothetical protein
MENRRPTSLYVCRPRAGHEFFVSGGLSPRPPPAPAMSHRPLMETAVSHGPLMEPAVSHRPPLEPAMSPNYRLEPALRHRPLLSMTLVRNGLATPPLSSAD